MRVNKIFIIGIAVLAVILFFVFRRGSGPQKGAVQVTEYTVEKGDVLVTLSTTGVVEPQNRLEVKSPINGRVEDIMVREGDAVTQGQVLALMSSTDRAALLDSARAQGQDAVAYWQDVYKATPLISPINGEVIVRSVEPGQTVTSADPVIVLSDRLIVNAQFDETDIGRVKLDQKAVITLDAFPETAIRGEVNHIAYESKLVNNVTIYEVDIVPHDVPDFFRSGMSATVEIIEQERRDVTRLPLEAVTRENGSSFVLLKQGRKTLNQEVSLGLRNDTYAEVVSGLNPGDTILIKEQKYVLPKDNAGSSPFMPGGRRR